MTDRKKIIAALAAHGELTYDDIERITGVDRTKARIAVNDAKKVKHIIVHKDVVSGQPAYKITPEGRQWIKSSSDARLEQAKATTGAAQSLEKHAVEITVDRHNKASDLHENLTKAETELARLTNIEADLAEWKRIAATAGANTPEELRHHLAFQDVELVEATRKANDAQEKLADLEAKRRWFAITGYLVTTINKKPRRFTKESSADAYAATSAKRTGLAEVFALHPIKKAVRGVEWKKSA